MDSRKWAAEQDKQQTIYGASLATPNTLRPASEIEQHLLRMARTLEELNARISAMRDALTSVLAESGPECPSNKADAPVQVSCATSDKLAIMHRQADAMVYEMQSLLGRLRV